MLNTISGLAIGVAIGVIIIAFEPSPCKAACVETSQSVMTCTSTAPMPTHESHGVLVIEGDNVPVLAMQGNTDQTIRDNQGRADYQSYLDSLANDSRQLTRALLK